MAEIFRALYDRLFLKTETVGFRVIIRSFIGAETVRIYNRPFLQAETVGV